MGKMDSRQKRYSQVFFGSAIINLIFLILFRAGKCNTLVTLNAIEICVYTFMGWKARKADYFLNFMVTSFVTIMIHTVVHLLLLGPIYGFQYIFIGVVPAVFYIAYITKRTVKEALIHSAIIFAIFFFSLIISSMAGINVYNPGFVIVNIVVFINISISLALAVTFMVFMVVQAGSDTDQLKNQNSDLELSASVDTLTGLKNRRSLDMYLKRAMANAKGDRKDFTVIMCDIDDFKHVNDTYGHECGDLVLKNIANIFKSETREDDIVFRWGGEEMLILVNGGNYIAGKLAERCRKAIEESEVEWNGNKVKVTITMGGAGYYQGVDEKLLLEKADANLYKGKKNGKNQVVM